jgi:hypothetical protein
MKKLKCREHKLKMQIVRKLRMLRKIESPIVRYRLENETNKLTYELDEVYNEMNDATH